MTEQLPADPGTSDDVEDGAVPALELDAPDVDLTVNDGDPIPEPVLDEETPAAPAEGDNS